MLQTTNQTQDCAGVSVSEHPGSPLVLLVPEGTQVGAPISAPSAGTQLVFYCGILFVFTEFFHLGGELQNSTEELWELQQLLCGFDGVG